MNLLEAIKVNSNTTNPVASTPTVNPLLQSQTENIAKQVQAASGKVVSSPIPTGVNLGERLAQKQAMEEQTQVSQEAAAKEVELDQQRKAQELEAAAEGMRLNEQALTMKQNFQQKAESLVSEYLQNMKKIETQRDQAKMEVASFLLRLSNDKYLNNLKVHGAKARLENNLKFNEELQRSIWSDEIELLNGDLNFKSLLRADERQFERDVANIDLNTAIALATTASDVENYKRISSGMVDVVKTGAENFDTLSAPVKNWWETRQQYSTGREEAAAAGLGDPTQQSTWGTRREE